MAHVKTLGGAGEVAQRLRALVALVKDSVGAQHPYGISYPDVFF